MRDVIKLGLILLLITAVAAAVLAWTNDITKEPIANQVLQANITARQSVLPDASEFEEMPKDQFANYDNILEVYKGLRDGQVVGYTIKTDPSGYGGPVEVMIGISADGLIQGVSIGNHSETPGLGAKASDDAFKSQYNSKKAEGQIDVIKAGTPKENEIMAISGATITSRAVTSGVNTAIQLYNEALK
ncbi:electron transport complex protein RnfG [Anaerosolibacter carboniphilus]|uniref:Ion-translocating oxidoreductase complex subunit G n=1 Tax=Anaerosolibacter carboniphilus TaxID=1417629 RepID=A0A841KS86_9FIRM|nr:RnfABCDGE type electron transport complex subunit G [Anaerosolibacter carboniphilus]MBB6214910.1 electron transport complex protein RnfG [Anaerosolibacter carboniphilus]